MSISDTLTKCREKIRDAETVEYSGKVVKVVGLTVESNGPTVNMGDVCRIYCLYYNKIIQKRDVKRRLVLGRILFLGKLSLRPTAEKHPLYYFYI